MKAVLVRYTSHRAFERVAQALGRKPQNWFTWTKPGYWYDVTVAEFERIKNITGVCRSRVSRKLLGKTWY